VILEELDQLEGRLRNVEALQATEQTQNVWRHHEREFEALLGEIESPLSFLSWLGRKTGEVSMPDRSRALKRLRDLRDALDSDPNALLREGGLLDEARATTRECLNALFDAARSAWITYCRELPTSDADLYAPFEDQERFRGLVKKARAEDEQLLALMTRPYLATADERGKLEKLLASRKTTRAKLPKVEYAEIREFVKGTAQTGIPLSAVTPQVWDWLRDNDLEDSYVVRKRPTGGDAVE
jgi:hypothetical protein